MPSLDLNKPINWDDIEEFEGGVLDLDYDYVWDVGIEEGNHRSFSFSICCHCISSRALLNGVDTAAGDGDDHYKKKWY
jgi:hypothetical protein